MKTERSLALKVLRICRLMTRQSQALDLYHHLLRYKDSEEHDVLMMIMRAEVPYAFLNRLPDSPILGDNKKCQDRWDIYNPHTRKGWAIYR